MPYTGIVARIPVGMEGLTGNINPSTQSPASLIEALNITYENGFLQKEGGASLYGQIPDGSVILAGYDWWPVAGSQRMIVATNSGGVWLDTGPGTFTLIGYGILGNTVPVCVEGGAEAATFARKLFLFSGSFAPMVLAGQNLHMTTVASPSVDWSGTNQPSCGCNHEGRLWAAGNQNDPHRLYYSTSTNHEDFVSAGAGSLSVFPGEGQGITAICSFKGILIVWKHPTGIYMADTRDPDLTHWSIDRISSAFGLPGPRCFCLIDNDILFIDQHGNFNILSGIQEFGNLGGVNVSQVQQIENYLDPRLRFERLPYVRAVYYAHKREAMFCLTAPGAECNNRRMTIDFKTQAPRFRFSDRDVNEEIWLRQDTRGVLTPAIGDAQGQVWLLDQPTRHKAGTPYRSTFQTPHLDGAFLDPSLVVKRKNGQFLELTMQAQDFSTTTHVDVYWDSRYTQTLHFNPGLSGNVLGPAGAETPVWTLDDPILGRLGPLKFAQQLRRRVHSSGVRVSFLVSTEDLGDFDISQMLFFFTVAGERVERQDPQP